MGHSRWGSGQSGSDGWGSGRYSDVAELLADDRAHVWHPYASVTDPLPVFPVASAAGVRLRLADGRELIDGMSSWWAAIHGYAHPVLDQAVRAQLDDMAHVMFGGLTHAPAVTLARTLVEITPAPLEKVFFSDSGSVAVGRDQDGVAVRAGDRPARADETAHRPAWLPRRHIRRHGRVRPRHRHASPVHRPAPASPVRARTATAFRRTLR